MSHSEPQTGTSYLLSQCLFQFKTNVRAVFLQKNIFFLGKPSLSSIGTPPLQAAGLIQYVARKESWSASIHFQGSRKRLWVCEDSQNVFWLFSRRARWGHALALPACPQSPLWESVLVCCHVGAHWRVLPGQAWICSRKMYIFSEKWTPWYIQSWKLVPSITHTHGKMTTITTCYCQLRDFYNNAVWGQLFWYHLWKSVCLPAASSSLPSPYHSKYASWIICIIIL